MKTSPSTLTAAPFDPWLHRFAMLVVLVAFFLITLGGTVTSKNVGMSVPDWPTTFNYNMFLFPPSMWKGGIFWEHSHRLVGSLMGLLTIALSIWLWITQKHRPWLRWVGIALLVLVIAQGIMGGLRVTQNSIRWAMVHGITGQIFLCTTVFIVAATSKWWNKKIDPAALKVSEPAKESAPAKPCLMHSGDCPMKTFCPRHTDGRTKLLSVIFLLVLMVQLTLGAVMRHSGAGLAIPDFPKSYGQWIPPFDAEKIAAHEADLSYDEARPIFTPAQVAIHFAHRCWAMVVLISGFALTAQIMMIKPRNRLITGPIHGIAFGILIQITLGAFVIWSGRHPEIATAHQATGAAILATAALLVFRIFRVSSQNDGEIAKPQSQDDLPLDNAALRGAHA